MPTGGDLEKPFRAARETVKKGDFDEVMRCLEEFGFKFSETTDPNHWMYYHPELKDDPIFRYPRNLYRPHGTRRSSDRISKHDQSQARQMIEALRATRSAAKDEGESEK